MLKSKETIEIEKILTMFTYYELGLSLSEVGKFFKICRKRIHYFFTSRGLKTRPLIVTEMIEYNGENYTRNNKGYWRKTAGDRELLHRQKWIDKNGAIPQNYQIHHIDEDKDNNELSNFQLLRIDEHSKLHGFKNNQFTIKNPQKYKK